MCKIRRSKIKKLIKQQRKGYLRNCIIEIDLDAIPNFKFDIKYWFEIFMQKGVILKQPEHLKIIKFKPRKL